MEKQPFKQWMKATYDKDELRMIAEHGCVAGVSGMIYYTETCALYDQHAEELHDMIYEYEQNYGDMPSYIVDNLGCLTGFKNAVVWFCAEVLAQDMISEDETEEA